MGPESNFLVLKFCLAVVDGITIRDLNNKMVYNQ
jgi:hypothetical protein